MSNVLIIATSRKTRGGITSVIKAHEQGEHWKKYHCKWLEAHIDTTSIAKIIYFFRALLTCILIMPFYDIVHIHHAGIRRKFVFFLLAKLYRRKVIAHLHACDPDTTINGKDKWMYKFMFSHSAKVIVLSEEWKQMVKDFLDVSENVVVLYNPCPDVKSIPYEQHQNYILYAGTLSKRKGYNLLIEAFSRIADKYPSWNIKFAGNGEIEEGRVLIKELELTDRVAFLGWVSGSEKEALFQKAGCFCLPSYAEGFPMGVLDAWAYGVPVITTPVGGIPDIAQEGRNILLFPAGDVNALSKALDSFLENKTLRMLLSKESFLLSETILNNKKICMELGNIYKSVSK